MKTIIVLPYITTMKNLDKIDALYDLINIKLNSWFETGDADNIYISDKISIYVGEDVFSLTPLPNAFEFQTEVEGLFHDGMIKYWRELLYEAEISKIYEPFYVTDENGNRIPKEELYLDFTGV